MYIFQKNKIAFSEVSTPITAGLEIVPALVEMEPKITGLRLKLINLKKYQR